jgi:N-carbamoyl-L-amino-acid hydrolase
MNPRELRCNGQRIKSAIEELAKIGGTAGGGMHRLSLTDADKRARDLFVQWLREIHLEISIDEMGNIFGMGRGKVEDLPMVLSGSHLDTQPFGGRFDGILGVTGVLEALRVLRENRIETRRSVSIVNWTEEEGTRFAQAMLGSGVWTGKFDRDWAYSRTDVQGKRFGEELERIGYRGPAPSRKWPVHAYFEYHIEQGPVLERIGKQIGVPRGILGITWFDVWVEGKANQAGPTPMDSRNDALVAAAEMVLKVNELPGKIGGDLVSTVGEMHISPNSRNVIPGRVRFTVDIRSWDDGLKKRAAEALKEEIMEVAQRRGCPAKMEVIWDISHTVFDPNLTKTVKETARQLGYSDHAMVSGAGHDAAYVNQVAPTAMIFVPSMGGRSHVEVENTAWEDCEAGANVLLHCLLQSANE